MNIDDLDFDKGNGLLPAIVQDAGNGQVLMLGYMNRAALHQTLEEERVTFYSRSREQLWTKGETSGNTLRLVDLQSDCDNDTLLVLAEPSGPVCHTGEDSCFYEKEFIPRGELDFLDDLEELIHSRKKELPEDSYTASLFVNGLDRIVQKVGEEAVETLIEAKNSDREKMTGEAADLIFHLMVLLAEKEIPLKAVVRQLGKRHRKDNHKHLS